MDIPEKMIEAQAQQMVEEFAQNIAMQGISFDQYMQFTGSTVEQLLEQVKPQAKARIESSLVLEEVVKAEKIEATDEEFEKELEDMATRYQMEKEKVAELLKPLQESAIERAKKRVATLQAEHTEILSRESNSVTTVAELVEYLNSKQ